VRTQGTEALGTKVEIKNMNSIRSLERALTYEAGRQIEALEAGEALVQETRHWDEGAGMTTSMRSKEEAFDYRYFPEPDIPPIEPSTEWIDEIRASLPELPRARRRRYETELGIKADVARVLVADRAAAARFDDVVALGAEPRAAAGWITQDVAALRNVGGEDHLTPQHIADAVRLVGAGSVSNTGAKRALEEAYATGEAFEAIVDRLGLRQVSDVDALGAYVDEVLSENPDLVEKFRSGKEAVIGALVGQVMAKTGGAGNAKVAQKLLRERLGA
jgi:aspartyl-tRNA(Asn)/glutamyl-tRNA(Gln) amidotransferase subunit B